MLAIKIKDEKLEQDFMEIVRNSYKSNLDLAVHDAIERLILTSKPANREKMIKLVEKFRAENKHYKNKAEIIETTIKNYRLKHEN